MSILTDHMDTVINLVGLATGLGASWAWMRMQITEMRKDITENRAASAEHFRELDLSLRRDLDALRQDHDLCRKMTMVHHEDMDLHSSRAEREYRAEWRQQTTERLARIETMLIDLKMEHVPRKNE